MSSDDLQLTLDRHPSQFSPGETLSGTFALAAPPADDLKAVELSVLWYTEGKGDEDMAVHYFHRYEPTSPEWRDLARPQKFSTQLPNSPLSYAGVILKIRWCVRLRVFSRRGKDAILDAPFQLGNVPAAAEIY